MELAINPKVYPIINPPTTYNVIYGGRGSGKSWAIRDILISKALTEQNILIMCVKGTMRSIEDSVKSLIEGGIYRLGLQDHFYITDKTIVCKGTGSRFIFNGLQHPDRLKSIEDVKYLWIEEASVDVTEDGLRTLFYTIRKNGCKIYLTFNPKLKTDAVYNMFIENKYDDSSVIKLNYTDNPACPDKTLRDAQSLMKRNYARYLHEFEGELADQTKDAMFKNDDIVKLGEDEEAKIRLTGWERMFERVVVSVDPSTTNSATSDACGIIVLGKYHGVDRYCIIEDATRVARPSDWSKTAISLYNKYAAQKLVYEGNQGGLIVEDLIKMQDKYIRFQKVHAKHGKERRAEAVQSLYEMHKVDHFQGLGELEGEMTTWSDGKGQPSPNRMDAMVWGLRYLCGKTGSGKMSAPASLSLY